MAGLESQAAGQILAQDRTLHVMFGGQSHDVSFSVVDIGDASTDEQIKSAFANYHGIPVEKLRFFQVDRHENGNATLRPQAVFG